MLKMDNIRLRYLALAIIALAAGFSLYILFRQRNVLFFKWLGVPVSTGTAVMSKNIPLNILAYSVPDGLWLLSGIFSIRFIWLKNEWCGRYVLLFCAAGIGLELLQLIDAFPGTFDCFDLGLLSAAAILEGMVYTKFMRQ
jgi:hypothetical protein